MYMFFVDDLLSGGMEIIFIIKLMAFVYLLFWLFVTFNRVPVLFGLTTVILAYFIFVYSLPTMLLVLFLIGFVFLGSQFQTIVWFGLNPIANIFGVDLTGQRHMEEAKFRYEEQALYAKAASDQPLTQEEYMRLQQMQQSQGEVMHQQQMLKRLAR
ncbi:hypothetical protein HY991_03695 [Candidatus Micrarchaeota archaeon]|nr:hypothetical protein [Candidatus Micrarchaeota archaeon]